MSARKRIERRASKKCEECFNAGIKEALKTVVEVLDERIAQYAGYTEGAETDEELKRLRSLVLHYERGDEINQELWYEKMKRDQNRIPIAQKEPENAIFRAGEAFGIGETVERVLQIIEAAPPRIDTRVDVATQLIERMVDRQDIREEVLKIIGGNEGG